MTGTNGKSTTTLLVAALLREAGLRVGVGGNLGTPALSLVGQAIDVAVLEVSSFQLETTQQFRPRVAAVLNFSPDHLDRHGDLDAYRNAKLRILENQQADDWAVLNAEDDAFEAFRSAARGRVLVFAASALPRPGTADAVVGFDAGALVLQAGDLPAERHDLTGLAPGRHHRENALAAAGAAFAAGARLARALPALAHFEGLPHRCELVADARGRDASSNDSKATNCGAAIRALEGFPRARSCGSQADAPRASDFTGAVRGRGQGQVTRRSS